MRTRQRSQPQGLRELLRRCASERGAAFLAELLVSVLIAVAASTALVRGVWAAPETSLREYRRLRALQELQNEMEYWKAQVFINGINTPNPSARHSVPIDISKRSKKNRILAEFEPAPTVRRLQQPGSDAYEITVTISWPEGKTVRRESLRTAINQLR